MFTILLLLLFFTIFYQKNAALVKDFLLLQNYLYIVVLAIYIYILQVLQFTESLNKLKGEKAKYGFLLHLIATQIQQGMEFVAKGAGIKLYASK